MCRHVCPVTRVTYNEATSPHGWALAIASVRRGLLDWNAETTDLLYQCADCGLCQSFCVTDQPLPDAIVAARAEVVRPAARPRALLRSTRRCEWGQCMASCAFARGDRVGRNGAVGSADGVSPRVGKRAGRAPARSAPAWSTRRRRSGGRAATRLYAGSARHGTSAGARHGRGA
jgi:hypothetical protein